MRRHVKASSAGLTEGSGNSRGLFRRAFATRGVSGDAKGSGAPASHRLRATLAVLALAIAAFAVTAAPASAAPVAAKVETVSSVSYTSAHVTGKITSPCQGFFGITAYSFQYSTDQLNWASGPGASSTCFGSFENQEVQGDVTGLKGGTKYFLRITITNNGIEAISPAPNPSTTTLAVDPPTISGTVATSSVFSTSATATGKVKRPANADPAFDVSACRFEYVTDAQFTATGFASATAVACDQATPFTTPDGETEVTASLTGLSPSTIYHLRLAAENANPVAVTKEAAAPFTTNIKVTAQPTVLAADDATEVGKRSAQASGEIERPAGADPALNVECRFEYVTDAQFSATGFTGAEQTPCAQNPITSSAPSFPAVSADVTAELPGLPPGTTYHLRLTAQNGAGTVSKDTASTFTTVALIHPSFTVDSVTEVGYTGFHVAGTADPGNQGTVWGPELTLAGKEEWTDPTGGAGIILLSAGSPPEHRSLEFPCGYRPGFCISPLEPGTAYQVRFGGYDYEEFSRYHSSYLEFTTKGTNTPPTASLAPITAVTTTTAHFSGTVDTHAPAGSLPDEAKVPYKTDWHIECTPECPGPSGEPLSGTVQAEEGSKAISLDAIRLQPNTFYEVKLIAHNVLGTVETPVQTFQTPLVLPDVKSEAGASDGEGGYFIQGVINSNNSKITSCEFEYGTTATYPNTYKAECLPNPSGPDEVQNIGIEATEGQFKLSFRGQTTGDLPFNASTAEVQAALRALSQVGPTGVNVSGTAQAYVVTFAGKLAGANVEPIKASNGTTPLGGGAGASVSTATEGGVDHPVTVEVHVENLTIGSHYHFRIFVTNAAGSTSTADREFIPTLAPPREGCENEAIREENSSLALPECRAFEMVTPAAKEGYGAGLFEFNGDDTVAYESQAGNIANSGNAQPENYYTTVRTAAGWQTRANLNGPTGSIYDGPEGVKPGALATGAPVFSPDLLSTVWAMEKRPIPGFLAYVRRPDGSYALLNKAVAGEGVSAVLSEVYYVGASEDFDHQIYNGSSNGGDTWGPGVYEFVGTGNDQPLRVDVDNSTNPITGCELGNSFGRHPSSSAIGDAVSTDARVIFLTVAGGCGGANPPANEIWARVGGTTSFDASASECTRGAADPGGACNAPAAATFGGAASDGSRVFFTTSQQLVNGDTDQTNDLYACDIPSGTPAPTGTANPCSSLREISATDADVQNVIATSEDGSTVYFNAKGVLAHNTDAFGEEAIAGDNNLYVWRQDAAHPAGQTTFIAPNVGGSAQVTPDGRYLALDTATPLLPTDTDNAKDVYRYDADTGEMIRASTGTTGTGGNGAGFDAVFAFGANGGGLAQNSHYAISDNGQKIVFNTAEALSPLDGNGSPDVYLWTPGRVSDISLSSAERGVIDGSGKDIYFQSAAALTPGDGDQSLDVYDARVNGGFSFAEKTCAGEGCQPPISPLSPTKPRASEQPGSGNPIQLKSCPKGKVKKHGKCVKKSPEKHSGKKHHAKKHKRTGSNHGGGK